MRKLVCLLFVASLGAVLLGGCSPASTDDSAAAPKTRIKDKTPAAGDE